MHGVVCVHRLVTGNISPYFKGNNEIWGGSGDENLKLDFFSGFGNNKEVII